jgi:hypothetical protein
MTFATNAILQAAQLNTHLRDNLIELKDPPTVVINSTTGYTTTSTSFVDVNAALEATIVTNGGRLFITWNFTTSGATWSNRLLLNGSPLTLTTPSVGWTGVLAAGTHVIKPQWLVTSGTATMTLYNIVVREVS